MWGVGVHGSAGPQAYPVWLMEEQRNGFVRTVRLVVTIKRSFRRRIELVEQRRRAALAARSIELCSNIEVITLDGHHAASEQHEHGGDGHAQHHVSLQGGHGGGRPAADRNAHHVSLQGGHQGPPPTGGVQKSGGGERRKTKLDHFAGAAAIRRDANESVVKSVGSTSAGALLLMHMNDDFDDDASDDGGGGSGGGGGGVNGNAAPGSAVKKKQTVYGRMSVMLGVNSIGGVGSSSTKGIVSSGRKRR